MLKKDEKNNNHHSSKKYDTNVIRISFSKRTTSLELKNSIEKYLRRKSDTDNKGDEKYKYEYNYNNTYTLKRSASSNLHINEKIISINFAAILKHRETDNRKEKNKLVIQLFGIKVADLYTEEKTREILKFIRDNYPNKVIKNNKQKLCSKKESKNTNDDIKDKNKESAAVKRKFLFLKNIFK
jgi:hypothetical protein